MSKKGYRRSFDEGALPECAIKRIQADVVAGYLGREYGTPLGLMFLRQEITKPQYEAALACVQAYEAYLRAIDVKSLRGASWERGARSTPIDPFSELGQKVAEGENQRKRRYERLREVVRGCGSDAFRDWEAVAYASVSPTWLMRLSVCRVAEALRAHGERRNRVARAMRRAKASNEEQKKDESAVDKSCESV